jgi:hypothetical protein
MEQYVGFLTPNGHIGRRTGVHGIWWSSNILIVPILFPGLVGFSLDGLCRLELALPLYGIGLTVSFSRLALGTTSCRVAVRCGSQISSVLACLWIIHILENILICILNDDFIARDGICDSLLVLLCFQGWLGSLLAFWSLCFGINLVISSLLADIELLHELFYSWDGVRPAVVTGRHMLLLLPAVRHIDELY